VTADSQTTAQCPTFFSGQIFDICPSFCHAMHFSAKRGLAIACRPSVRPSVRPSGHLCDSTAFLYNMTLKCTGHAMLWKQYMDSRPQSHTGLNFIIHVYVVHNGWLKQVFVCYCIKSLHMYLGKGINQSGRWTMEWNAGSSNRRIRYWHILLNLHCTVCIIRHSTALQICEQYSLVLSIVRK